MTLRIRCVALVLAVAAGLGQAATAPAGELAVPAQESTTTSEPLPAPDIIPEPGSGTEPTDPGDRGGALQTVVFAVIVLGVVVIGVLVVRESRRARQRRGF